MTSARGLMLTGVALSHGRFDPLDGMRSVQFLKAIGVVALLVVFRTVIELLA